VFTPAEARCRPDFHVCWRRLCQAELRGWLQSASRYGHGQFLPLPAERLQLLLLPPPSFFTPKYHHLSYQLIIFTPPVSPSRQRRHAQLKIAGQAADSADSPTALSFRRFFA
jgi:hypothetical protein